MTPTGLIALAAATALLGGCRESKSPATEAPMPAAPLSDQPLHLDHAQPALPTIQLWVGAEELATEVALTRQQVATGMMFRTNMPENAAMLFVFGEPHRTAFYMKNTVLPLSAAYIDPEGIILEIHDLQPRDETSVPASTDQIQYVLEVNQGWFKRHNVSTGASVRTQYGSLRDTFTRRR